MLYSLKQTFVFFVCYFAANEQRRWLRSFIINSGENEIGDQLNGVLSAWVVVGEGVYLVKGRFGVLAMHEPVDADAGGDGNGMELCAIGKTAA